jgi:hypothetical protein
MRITSKWDSPDFVDKLFPDGVEVTHDGWIVTPWCMAADDAEGWVDVIAGDTVKTVAGLHVIERGEAGVERLYGTVTIKPYQWPACSP